MVWLGAMMQKDYKSQVEASVNSLADASASIFANCRSVRDFLRS